MSDLDRFADPATAADGRCPAQVCFPVRTGRQLMMAYARCPSPGLAQYSGHCSESHQAATEARRKWEQERDRWAALNPGRDISDFPRPEPRRPFVRWPRRNVDPATGIPYGS